MSVLESREEEIYQNILYLYRKEAQGQDPYYTLSPISLSMHVAIKRTLALLIYARALI